MIDRKKYEDLFIWLITPQNENEARIFKEKGLVDSYIEIINDIPNKSDQQLMDSIDIQLAGYGGKLDRK